MPEQEFDPELPTIAGMENVYCSPGDIVTAVLNACCGLLDQSSDGVNVNFAETGTEVRTAAVRLDSFDLKTSQSPDCRMPSRFSMQ